MRRHAQVGLVFLLAFPTVAQAGMPMIYVSELARLRVQTLSFFLVGLLLSAVAIRLLWNYLRGDFPVMPYLSYGKALGVVTLWGLLFILVLTMISGARELMTPGAWEKRGLTYRLTEPAEPKPPASPDSARWQKLDALRFALWEYARTHDGVFPPDRSAPEVAPTTWELPGPTGLRYLYTGPKPAGSAAPLAYEPELDGPQRLVLLTSGEIKAMTVEELIRALPAETR